MRLIRLTRDCFVRDTTSAFWSIVRRMVRVVVEAVFMVLTIHS